MDLYQKLGDLTRGQLYVMIKELKEEINYLKTDLIKYKFISNSYQKYFEYFSEINETIASNEEVLHSFKDIKLFNSLTEKKPFVPLKRLSDNYLNETPVQSVEQHNSNSQYVIESTERQNQNNERDDTSEDIPERKPIKIEIKIEDIKEENESFITESLIDRKPIIEIIENISINLKNNSEINVNSETNISHIKVKPKSGHQLNETLNQKIVKTETQSDDNSEEVSNESQTRIEAIKECKPEEEECIECIDITENGSDLKQVIDGCDEELKNSNENHSKTANQLITQTTEEVFICDICSANLKSKKSLRIHKNRHTNKYLCNVEGCQYRGSSISHLKRHMKAMHGVTDHNSDRPEDNNSSLVQMSGNRFIIRKQKYSKFVFECEVCSAIFNTRSTLLQHKNKHTNDLYKCVVNGCDNQFKTKYDLKLHENKSHKILGQTSGESEIKPFECLLKYCKNRFSSRKYMRKHMRRTHKLTSNLVNIYFKKYDKSLAFKDSQTLDNNNKITNTSNIQRTNDSNKQIEVIELDDESEDKPLIECQLKVNKTIENISHKRSRNEEEVVEDSDEERAEKPRIKSKEKTKKKGKYVCDHNGCGKRLKSSLTLKAHKERHTGVVYKCFWSNCSALFNNNQRFRSHLIRHKGIYRCDWSGCRYRGTSAAILRSHKNRHLENRLLLCRVVKGFIKKIF